MTRVACRDSVAGTRCVPNTHRKANEMKGYSTVRPRNLFPITFLTVAMVVSLGRGLSAQDAPGADELLRELRRATDGLLKESVKVGDDGDREELRSLWIGMIRSVSTLRASGDGKDIPEPYQESLRFNIEALEDIAAGRTAPEETVEICRDVAKDLDIKATFARRDQQGGPFV